MPLKILLMCDPDIGQRTFQEWMDKNPGIKILTRHICPHGNCDHLYIFYDRPVDHQYRKDMVTVDENAQLEMLMSIAKSLKFDEVYLKLTNKIQRRLYLLHTKNLPSCDADLVSELMTPQLSTLIEGSL